MPADIKLGEEWGAWIPVDAPEYSGYPEYAFYGPVIKIEGNEITIRNRGGWARKGEYITFLSENAVKCQ